jgi:hypothetical protein
VKSLIKKSKEYYLMKKLFAILLMTAMLLACTSCGRNKSNDDNLGKWYSSIDWDDGWNDNVERWEDIIVEDIIVEDIIVEDIIVEEIIIK